MKKGILSIIVVVAIVASILVGCGGSDTKVIEGGAPSASATEEATASEMYFFTYDGIDMVVDTDAQLVVERLADPKQYFESPSCAGEGIGKLYGYDDFEIQTYPVDGKDMILYVMLRTDNVATNEGIDLSKTKDDVKAAYGEPTSDSGDALTYEKGGMKLVFLFDGEDMISIEYDSSKN